MAYAVNVADLHAFKDDLRIQVLLLPVLDREAIVDAEPGQFDGAAVLVQSDLAVERWDAIYTILRHGLGRVPGLHKNKDLRIYQGSGRTWKRI